MSMPTYDYMCDSCGATFEVQHKMSDTPIIVCPKCGASAHQVFSAGFGLNFTGKGFYQTDTQKTAESAKKADVQGTSLPTKDKPAHSCGGGCGCSGGCPCSS